MASTHAFIFARGGSKGIPKKNLSLLGGIPLLVHSIRAAQSNIHIDQIFVSSDCSEILDVGQSEGAIPILRPQHLANDSSPELYAWKHAVAYVIATYGAFDRFISLPCTAPLRSQIDINNALTAFTPAFDLVMTMTKSARSPWFNMVIKDDLGCIRKLNNQPSIIRRQDSPTTFDLTTVAYVTSPGYILNCQSLWDGQVFAVEVPQERSMDIDTPFDLKLAQLIYDSNRAE